MARKFYSVFLVFSLSFTLAIPPQPNISINKNLAPLTQIPAPEVDPLINDVFHSAVFDFVSETENELDNRYIRFHADRQFGEKKGEHEFQQEEVPFEVGLNNRIFSAISSLSMEEREKEGSLYRFLKKWAFQPEEIFTYRDELGKRHLFLFFVSKEKRQILVREVIEGKKEFTDNYAPLPQNWPKGSLIVLGELNLDGAVLTALRLNLIASIVKGRNKIPFRTPEATGLLHELRERLNTDYKSQNLEADLALLIERDNRFYVSDEHYHHDRVVSFLSPPEAAAKRLAKAAEMNDRIKEEEVVFFKDLSKESVDIAGGKGANLGELGNVPGISVPQGVVVTAHSYRRFIQEAKVDTGEGKGVRTLAQIITDELAQIDYLDDVTFFRASDNIREAFLKAFHEGQMPQSIQESIQARFKELARQIKGRDVSEAEFNQMSWAIRSSGTREDLEDASSAGQQATFLNVRGMENIIEKVVEDWASLWTGRAIAYRNGQIVKSFLRMKPEGSDEPGLTDQEFKTLIQPLKDREGLITKFKAIRDPKLSDEALDHKVVYSILEEVNEKGILNEHLKKLKKQIDDFTDTSVIEIAVVGQRQVKSTRAFTMLSLDESTGWQGMTFNRLQELTEGKGRVWRIEFNYGLGESLVGGEVTPDSFLVHKVGNKYNIIERVIGTKANMMVFVEDLLENVGLNLEQGVKLAKAAQFPFLLARLNLDSSKAKSISKSIATYLDNVAAGVAQKDKGISYTFLDHLPFVGLKKEREDNDNDYDDESRLKLIAEEVKRILEAPENVKIKVDPAVLKRLSGSGKKKEMSEAQDQLIMLARAVSQAQKKWEGADTIRRILNLNSETDVISFIQTLAQISKHKTPQEIEFPKVKEKYPGYTPDQWIALSHALKGLTKGEFTVLTFTPETLQKQASVADAEVMAVARNGERIQNHYNHVVDVEGAFDPEGRVQIVQARPVTTEKEIDEPNNLRIVTWVPSKEAEKIIDSQKSNTLSDEEIKEIVRGGNLEPLKGLQVAAGLGTRNAFSGRLIWIDESKGDLAQQLSLVKKGDIILTRFTSPDYVEAMKRSSGVISIEGGATSHAAIVSRELGIATVVGVGESIPKWVFELLEEGVDIPVTIDANRNTKVGQKAYLGVLPTEESIIDIDLAELEKLGVKGLKFGLIGANPNSFREISKITQYSQHYGVNLARIEFVVADIGVHQKALRTLDLKNVIEKAEAGETLSLSELMLLASVRSEDQLHLDAEKVVKNNDVVEKMEEKLVGYRSGIQYFKSKIIQGLSSIAATHKLDQSVVIRSLDFKTNEMGELIGGKLFENVENSPMIGERGLQREIDPRNRVFFEMFLDAFQDAVDDGYTNLSLMYPIVRHPDHLREAIEIMKARGVKPKSFGIMIEIPSNVWLVDEFADILKEYQDEMKDDYGHEMDVFFSFGTNDLTQLTLGTGRDNSRLKHLFKESNEAVVRSIVHVAKAAKRNGIKMGLCGNAVNALIEELTNLEKEPEENREQIQILVRTITTIFRNLDSVGVDINNYKSAVEKAAKYLNSGGEEVSFEISVPNVEPRPETIKMADGQYVRQDVDQVLMELGAHPKLLIDYDKGEYDPNNKESLIQDQNLRSLYRMSLAKKIGVYEGEIQSAKELFKARIRDGIVRAGLQGKRVVHGTTYMLTRDPNPANPSFANKKLIAGELIYEAEREENPPLDFTGMSRNLDPEYLELFQAELEAVKEAALALQNQPNTRPVFLQLNGVRTAEELKDAFDVIVSIGMPENVKIGLGIHKASNPIVIDQMAQLKIPGRKSGLSFVHIHASRLVQEMYAADMYHDKIWLDKQLVEEVLVGPRRVVKQAAMDYGLLYLEDELSQPLAAKGETPRDISFSDQLLKWNIVLKHLREQSGNFTIDSIKELYIVIQELETFYVQNRLRIKDTPKRRSTVTGLAQLLENYFTVYKLNQPAGDPDHYYGRAVKRAARLFDLLETDGLLRDKVHTRFVDPLEYDLSRTRSAVEAAI